MDKFVSKREMSIHIRIALNDVSGKEGSGGLVPENARSIVVGVYIFFATSISDGEPQKDPCYTWMSFYGNC